MASVAEIKAKRIFIIDGSAAPAPDRDRRHTHTHRQTEREKEGVEASEWEEKIGKSLCDYYNPPQNRGRLCCCRAPHTRTSNLNPNLVHQSQNQKPNSIPGQNQIQNPLTRRPHFHIFSILWFVLFSKIYINSQIPNFLRLLFLSHLIGSVICGLFKCIILRVCHKLNNKPKERLQWFFTF